MRRAKPPTGGVARVEAASAKTEGRLRQSA
jgi:hypothetical protein